MRGDLEPLRYAPIVLDLLATAWGLELRAVGETFPCLLARHEGHDASCWYDAAKTRVHKYACWAKGERRPVFYLLSEVHAWIAYREHRLLSPTECAVWNRRLLYDGRRLEPCDIELPALPDSAPATHQEVRTGFALLVGLRWLDHRGQPVAYARRFASAWCTLGERQAGEGIEALIAHGVIREAGKADDGRTRLWLPGETR